MSINEITVHWCGHSEQKIMNSPIYREISKGFVQNSVILYDYIKKLVEKHMPSDLKILTFRELMK